jgi:hypothetical protein
VYSHLSTRLDSDYQVGSVSTMLSLTRYSLILYNACEGPANLLPQTTVDIFVDQEKINFFRVTFLMERMCPLSFGLGRRFNETVCVPRRAAYSGPSFNVGRLVFQRIR